MADEKNIAEFEKWWTDTGSGISVSDPKSIAASIWDAAVLTAARMLDAEKNRLVSTKNYVEAAATRDARHVIETAFTRPKILCRFCAYDLQTRPDRCPGCGAFLPGALP